MKIVLASSNQGKVREFQEIMQGLDIELIPQSALGISDAQETGLSFIENAILKARHAAKLSGLPTIADDSGLAVSALKGAPGIYSARYAGTHGNSSDNIQKLLHEMQSIPQDERQAQFHCVLAFLTHADDPVPLICDGIWRGTILTSPRGEGGFGYDPIFYVEKERKTAAELPATVKNKISHRGIALQSFLTLIPEKLCTLSQSNI